MSTKSKVKTDYNLWTFVMLAEALIFIIFHHIFFTLPFLIKSGDEIERSIELLDRVLSEFEDPESLPPIEPDSPSQGHQSEDDGYMSMNGKKYEFTCFVIYSFFIEATKWCLYYCI